MNIRIVLVDDHKIIREGLSSMLKKQPGMEVVGEAENGRKAVALAQKFSPDVVIIDVTMPDLNGIEATGQIISESKNTKVVALSMHSDKRFVKRMIQAGASGYVLKDCPFHDLVRAIRAVVQGQAYLSPQIASVVIGEFLKKDL